MSIDHAVERTYYRGTFRHDIAFSIVSFSWLYWFCEMRWFRKALGGRWYQISYGDISRFWSQRSDWEGRQITSEHWLLTPMAKANDTAMGTLVRLLVVLGAMAILFKLQGFALAAPIAGMTTLIVWTAVVAWGVWNQRLIGSTAAS